LIVVGTQVVGTLSTPVLAANERPPLGRLAVKDKVEQQAEPFDLADVRLLDSPFLKAQNTCHQYLLELEPKRFLAFFQQHAGLLKGDVWLGWEPKGLGDAVANAMLGHYLSACASMYRATGDQKLLERINMLVAGLAQCQQVPGNEGLLISNREVKGFADCADGKLQAEGNRFNNLGIPWYNKSKLYNGLFDVWALAGCEQAKEVLVKMTDWCDRVVAKFDDDKMQRMLRSEHGDIADALANVYAMTGEPRHLALAKKFRHDAVFAPIAADTDCLDFLHANTQIPKFRGYQRIYELTGDTYWGNAAANFWKFVALQRTYANGGNSYHEHFHPLNKFEDAMHVTPGPETCNTYNMLRLTWHLFSVSPQAPKMDYYERALYNQILPSQHPCGGFTYYQGLLPGTYRTYSEKDYIFWCCVGTGMQNHGLYGEAAYAHKGERLYVNLFIPSELNWQEQSARILQTTAFPDEPRTQLQMKLAAPKTFTVSVRHPGWAVPGPFVVTVNGKKVPVKAKPGSYVDIKQEWKDGDTLGVEFPMPVRSEQLPNSRGYVALLYGPVLLAANLGREGLSEADFRGGAAMTAKNKLSLAEVPTVVVPLQEIPAHLKRNPNEPLRFQTQGLCKPNDVQLLPIYQIYDERYSLYFPVSTPATWEQDKLRWSAKEEYERNLEKMTVDEVRVGEQQPEADHHLEFKDSQASNPRQRPNIGRIWREAFRGGWFSYKMKVAPGKPMQILCTYWGGDGGNRAWDILVDDTVVGGEEAAPDQPGEFVRKVYPVPAELTRGKETVTVKIQARKGLMTGSVFDCRMVIKE
jgi:DUF1680 family protein